MRLRVLLALLFVGAIGYALVFFVSFKNAAIQNYFATHKPPPTPVEISEAQVGQVPQALSAIGTLRADQEVNVTTQIAGQIRDIYFTSGRRVKRGDKLVQLDDTPERADLASFQAQERLAQANLNRALTLLRQDFAAQQTVDQNRATLDQIKAQVQRTQAIIDEKVILAPFDGVLGIRHVNVGQYVNAGANMVSLVNLDTLRVDFTLPEQAAPKLTANQDVNINVDAVPGTVFHAKISAFEPRVSESTRTLSIEATLANPGEVLRPGMFANVSVILPPIENSITIPVTALDATLYGSSVLTLEAQANSGDNVFKLKREPVTTGNYFGNRVQIVSGLRGGEKVITSGQSKLQPGVLVTPTQTNALIPPAVVARP